MILVDSPYLWTFIGKVAVFTALEAGDLVKSLESVGPAIALYTIMKSTDQLNSAQLINRFHKTIYDIVRYHGMHPVVALGVRHEGLPQLVHLLVFQLLNQEVVRIKKGPGIGGENHLGHFMAVRHFVPDFSTIVASYHNLGWIQVRCWIEARWRNFELKHQPFCPFSGPCPQGLAVQTWDGHLCIWVLQGKILPGS